MYQTTETSDDTLHYELARCHTDFGQLFYKKREISAGVHHPEKVLQFNVVESNFVHRDTAYYCYSLLAQIHGQLLNFPAALLFMTAAMEILPKNSDHIETTVSSDCRLLEVWKQIVQVKYGGASRGNMTIRHQN